MNTLLSVHGCKGTHFFEIFIVSAFQNLQFNLRIYKNNCVSENYLGVRHLSFAGKQKNDYLCKVNEGRKDLSTRGK